MPRRPRLRSSSRDSPQTIGIADSFVLRYAEINIHESALRHDISSANILHAKRYAIAFFYLDQSSYEMKTLIVGPDTAGNLLELVGVVRDNNELIVIHAMRLRPKFFKLIDGT